MGRSHPTALALPIELLLEIIKESISLPQFLDVNHIHEVTNPLSSLGPKDYKYPMEDAYWEINRHLNVLRCACKSFDVYLRRFEHRYVRLIDLYHKYVPMEAVSKAIRIDLTPWCRESARGQECDFCLPSESPENFTKFFSAILDQEFAVEIVTSLDEFDYDLVSQIPDIAHPRMPHLKAIIDGTFDNEEGRGVGLMSALDSPNIPQLQFLHLIADDYDLSLPSFTARNLVTFAYLNPNEPFPEWMTTTGSQKQLPALQHLRFLTPLSELSEEASLDQKLIPILKVFGPQLRSLLIGDCSKEGSNLLLPKECWELCPQLERIDTTLILDTPPPQGHPLHTLSVFSPDIYVGTWIFADDEPCPFQVDFLDQISDHSHVRRIILQQNWGDLSSNSIHECSEVYGATIQVWVDDCARICAEKSIGLEDYDGVAFENGEMASLIS